MKDEVIKRFCSDSYFDFLSRQRSHKEWDSLERVLRDSNPETHPEAADLESCGIMVRVRICFMYMMSAMTRYRPASQLLVAAILD